MNESGQTMDTTKKMQRATGEPAKHLSKLPELTERLEAKCKRLIAGNTSLRSENARLYLHLDGLQGLHSANRRPEWGDEFLEIISEVNAREERLRDLKNRHKAKELRRRVAQLEADLKDSSTALFRLMDDANLAQHQVKKWKREVAKFNRFLKSA
jgi:hypothetical protein